MEPERLVQWDVKLGADEHVKLLAVDELDA